MNVKTLSIGCGLVGFVGVLGVSAPAQAAAEVGGNESLSWSVPGAPTAGMSSLTFPMTVGADTARQSGTYFAMQYSFAGIDSGGYAGLQPRADADGRQRLHGVFSSFIAGTTSADPNCHDGADGGSGVSCSAEFDATYGHRYDITVQQTGADTWSGSATDTATGASTHLGSYTLPQGSGLLNGSHGGFVEYYLSPSCNAQPFYDVIFGRPRSGNMTGTVKWNSEYGGCVGAGNTIVSDTVDGGVRITRGMADRPSIGLGLAEYGKGGVTIRGWAEPGSRLKTTNDPGAGWYDPEQGPVYAAADGTFTLTTNRTINGQAAVKSFNPTTGQALSESDSLTPQTHLDSATHDAGGVTIRGWAQPGSRLKTTNDPGAGWYDPEGGAVVAATDGSFVLTTQRTINGQAAVKSFNPTTDQALSESNHLDITR